MAIARQRAKDKYRKPKVKLHRRTKVEMEAARASGVVAEVDPFFEGCMCFVMFDGSWDREHCFDHKAFPNEDPTIGHVADCACNQCLDKARLLVRIEKGLVKL